MESLTKRNLRNRRKKQFIEQYQVYDNIDDLPIWNFKKVQSKQELRYLLVLDKYKPLPKEGFDEDSLFIVWTKLNDQYIDKFRFSDEQQMIYDKLLQLYKFRLNKIIKQDRSLITKINIAKKEIGILLKNKNNEKQAFEKQVMILSANLNMIIDTKKMSVTQYFYLIEIYESQIKQNNEAVENSKKSNQES